jgi:hypothetical protein
MLFRLGADRDAVLARLNHGGDFMPAVCQTSAGLSIDEPAIKISRQKRLYYFAPRPWNLSTYKQISINQ